MKLFHIAAKILIENDESGSVEVDKKMTEKTINDDFVLNDRGLNYVRGQLEKLNKKASRIGVAPLELKIIKTEPRKYKDELLAIERVIQLHTVEIIGKSPIIDGYKFVASIEHTAAGNIVNISPEFDAKALPPEYKTSNTDCDYCHTKRDRLNTFVLKDEKTGKFIKVGRSCLKNFLPDKNPQAILEYAKYIESLLNALVGGESMDENEGGGGGRWNKYYNSDDFMMYVCIAYYINGERYISGTKAKEDPTRLVSTANFALDLMNLRWNKSDDYRQEMERKMNAVRTKAKELADKVNAWKDAKDWDAEMAKKPEMETYFNNLKVISKSPAVQFKNAGYHASLLAVYLREAEWNNKKAVDSEKAKTKTYIGNVGEKITFVGKLMKQKSWDSNYGTTFMYIFSTVDNENEVVYYSSRDLDIEDGKTYKVVGSVKAHQVSKYTQAPQTIITRAKATEP